LIANFAQIDRLFASVCMRLDHNLLTLENAIDQLGMTTDGNFFKVQNLFVSTVSKIDDNLQQFQREMYSCTSSIGQLIHDAHEETLNGLCHITDEVDVANENLQSIGIGETTTNKP
jgi:hypothetical protein